MFICSIVSLSSAVSSSSQGSGHDDGDALGDVFLWGEGTGDGLLGGGNNRLGNCSGAKMDSLVPKALESAVILDVQNISCGGHHAALVTKKERSILGARNLEEGLDMEWTLMYHNLSSLML